MSTFQCRRCNREGRYPSWVTARWSENTVHRCEYCGSAHCVKYGDAPVALGPELQPIWKPGRLSPWRDGKYRPYLEGVFECEFRNGLRLRLRWSGSAWTWCGKIVDMTDLVKWRGTWA